MLQLILISSFKHVVLFLPRFSGADSINVFLGANMAGEKPKTHTHQLNIVDGGWDVYLKKTFVHN